MSAHTMKANTLNARKSHPRTIALLARYEGAERDAAIELVTAAIGETFVLAEATANVRVARLASVLDAAFRR